MTGPLDKHIDKDTGTTGESSDWHARALAETRGSGGAGSTAREAGLIRTSQSGTQGSSDGSLTVTPVSTVTGGFYNYDGRDGSAAGGTGAAGTYVPTDRADEQTGIMRRGGARVIQPDGTMGPYQYDGGPGGGSGDGFGSSGSFGAPGARGRGADEAYGSSGSYGAPGAAGRGADGSRDPYDQTGSGGSGNGRSLSGDNSGAAYANASWGNHGRPIQSDASYYTDQHIAPGDTNTPTPYADSQQGPITEKNINAVMQGLAMSYGSDASKAENYTKSGRLADGRNAVGPFAIDSNILDQWGAGLQDSNGQFDQNKLAQLVQNGELTQQSAQLVQSPEFAQFQQDLAAGKQFTPDQIARYMPPDLQQSIVHDLAKGMAEAETAQLGTFDAGAAVVAIRAGKVLSKQDLGEASMSSFAQTIDTQLDQYITAAKAGQPGSSGAPGAAGTSGDQSQGTAAAQGQTGDLANGPGQPSDGLTSANQSSQLQGDTIGSLYVSAPANPARQRNLQATDASGLEGETIGDLFTNGPGIAAGQTSSRADMLRARTQRQQQ